jgi:splicing factor 3B subunit 2
MAAQKMTKNQLRRMKKKEQKAVAASKSTSEAPEDIKQESPSPEIEPEYAPAVKPVVSKPKDDTVDIDDEDVSTVEVPEMSIPEDDPNYAMYKQILERFGGAKPDEEAEAENKEKGEMFFDDDDQIPDEDEEAAVPTISKKQRKLQNKLSVAELKALVAKPELVDWTDTSAPDPRLLVHLKSYRNVVPVPSHWSLKREYLSSKRGVEKAPFSLPKFIQETGIAEMRDAVLEKQAEASLKQKQRERVQPKMGKLDIDYQKLYEAFFRHQTKPELTRFGEVYYEGKEYETNLRHLRPGELSDELKEALNIPPGAPPPWLINMQRYGPPPSYPSLKIPGLNAPPPPGGSWGFHPGGYGKPPVDEFNRPLYGGDIFGVLQPQVNNQPGEPVERTLWGELQAQEEEEEEEEEEESDEEAESDEDMAGTETPGGLATPSGMTSAVPTEFGGEIDTGANFDLRKSRRSGTETEEHTGPRSAYTVLPERQTRVEGFFGTDRAYDLSHAPASQEVKRDPRTGLPILGEEDSRKRKSRGDVEVAIDPENMNEEQLRRVYEQQQRQQGVAGVQGSAQWGNEEDLSEFIESESRKRLKRDEERRQRR